ncbi:hypothetical protein L7F22_029875 [Adiantum nelumboides]|nr:hypothetical protein [Adiantum nelumboides]
MLTPAYLLSPDDRKTRSFSSATAPSSRLTGFGPSRRVAAHTLPSAKNISSNLEALEKLQAKYACELLFVESGGDNLAASYSSELPTCTSMSLTLQEETRCHAREAQAISQSDILVINKIDLAPHVGASLEVMKRDADKMRDGGPTIFTSVKLGTGVGRRH